MRASDVATNVMLDASGVKAAYNAVPKGTRKTIWSNPQAGREASNAHGARRMEQRAR